MVNLTFSQAQGLEPLPSQAAIGSISAATTAALWRVVVDNMLFESERYIFKRTGRHRILCDWWVNVAHRMIDEAPYNARGWKERIKPLFKAGFPDVYDFVQFLLDSEEVSPGVKDLIGDSLISTLAAYRVVEGKIVPFVTQAQHGQLIAAIDKAQAIGAAGARSHLTGAGQALTSGAWAKSIHESVSAVESAAKFASGEHGKDLNGALATLKAQGKIAHPALAAALTKLYAYSSDKAGYPTCVGAGADRQRNRAGGFLDVWLMRVVRDVPADTHGHCFQLERAQ